MFEWVLNTPLQLLCDFSTVTMISNQFFSKKKLLEPPQTNHNAQHLLPGVSFVEAIVRKVSNNS